MAGGGGGETVYIKGRGQVPAADWVGGKWAKHRLSLAVYGVTGAIVGYFVLTAKPPKLNPVISSADRSEEAFVRDYLKQKIAEDKAKQGHGAHH